MNTSEMILGHQFTCIRGIGRGLVKVPRNGQLKAGRIRHLLLFTGCIPLLPYLLGLSIHAVPLEVVTIACKHLPSF